MRFKLKLAKPPIGEVRPNAGLVNASTELRDVGRLQPGGWRVSTSTLVPLNTNSP